MTITQEKEKTYTSKDIDESLFRSKTVAMIGYGAQGYAQANNLKDSGVNIILGLRKDGNSWKKAQEDGFSVYTIEEATKNADILQIVIPDEIQAKVFKEAIEPNLKSNQYLMFAHGFNICFDKIRPQKDINVLMVAPKGSGFVLRNEYLSNRGIPALFAIHQDPSGNSKEIALGYASCLGCAKSGIIKTTFQEEAIADLFSEQTILCGGAISLVKAGFDILVKEGINPKIAYFECLHELKLITDLLYSKGIYGMDKAISNTAEYGGLTRGERVINEKSKFEMQEIFNEIKSGKFADEWLQEYNSGSKLFKALEENDKNLLIEKTGNEIRSMFEWNK